MVGCTPSVITARFPLGKVLAFRCFDVVVKRWLDFVGVVVFADVVNRLVCFGVVERL
jgi:hypothetical protein